jgi:hypothetical protein
VFALTCLTDWKIGELRVLRQACLNLVTLEIKIPWPNKNILKGRPAAILRFNTDGRITIVATIQDDFDMAKEEFQDLVEMVGGDLYQLTWDKI